VIALACCLRWPGLQTELHTDDYVQAAMLESAFPGTRSALSLYDFGGRDAADRQRLRDFGWFPWWSSSDLRLAMFRPLSSALVAADHAFGRFEPRVAHLHSLIWFVALLGSVAILLRALMPPAAAVLALAFYAAEPGLSIPFAWLPNRCALAGATFGVLGVHAYLCWRRRGARWGAIAAPCAFFVAALAGEYGLTAIGYAISFEVVVAPEHRFARLRALVWAVLPAAAVVAIGVGLGYGVRGSEFYVSPLSEPLHYLGACIVRLPVLAAELVFAVPASWHPLGGLPASAADVRSVLAFAAQSGAFILLAVSGRGFMRHASPELRTLGIGALLGFPLLAGALPEARLLITPAIGFDAVLAFVVVALWQRTAGGSARARFSRWAAALLLATLLGLQLGVKLTRAHLITSTLRAKAAAQLRWALATEADDVRARNQQWFVIAAADFMTATILPFARWFHGHPMPRGYHLLSSAHHVHELERIDDVTLGLSVFGSEVAGAFAGSLHRPASAPFAIGDEIGAGAFRVRVERVFEGQPVRMRFTFPKSLDDPQFVFLHPMVEGLRRIEVPAVGSKLRLPAPSTPRLHW
jgi:hypothetical protein